MGYEIQLKGASDVERVEDADAYAQEGALTTFFRSRDGRAALDCWAKRLASYRTADITRIRWSADAGRQGGPTPTTVELKAV
jgi:hypothetical protein